MHMRDKPPTRTSKRHAERPSQEALIGLTEEGFDHIIKVIREHLDVLQQRATGDPGALEIDHAPAEAAHQRKARAVVTGFEKHPWRSAKAVYLLDGRPIVACDIGILGGDRWARNDETFYQGREPPGCASHSWC
jgi:hypothetical protein